MKTTLLSDLINIPEKQFVIGKYSIINQTCHHLFKTRAEQRLFYEALDTQYSNLIVIPCGPSSFTKSNFLTLASEYTIAGLLRTLNQILRGESLESHVLHTIVIENLSMFYWDLKVLDDFNFALVSGTSKFENAPALYLKLVAVINQIKVKYKCNVIVTSLDFEFERGYDSNISTGSTEFTHFPSEYLHAFDYIFHSNGNELLRLDRKGCGILQEEGSSSLQ